MYFIADWASSITSRRELDLIAKMDNLLVLSNVLYYGGSLLPWLVDSRAAGYTFLPGGSIEIEPTDETMSLFVIRMNNNKPLSIPVHRTEMVRYLSMITPILGMTSFHTIFDKSLCENQELYDPFKGGAQWIPG